MKNINKKFALKLYKRIQMSQGEHNGRWEDEYSQENSSIMYFHDMVRTANVLDLNYSDNPKDYIKYDDDIIYIEDTAGAIIYDRLENILKKIILGD